MKSFKEFVNESNKEPTHDEHGKEIRPKHVSVEHKGRTYYHTGKVGHRIDSGELSHEYNAHYTDKKSGHEMESRLWVRHKSGKIDMDD
mgnify:CR=1 FL=1